MKPPMTQSKQLNTPNRISESTTNGDFEKMRRELQKDSLDKRIAEINRLLSKNQIPK